MPAQRDAEPFPDRAVAPVRRDEVACPHRPLGAAVPFADDCGEPVLVSLERGQLGAPLDPCTELRGPRPEDRLQADLRDEQPR